MMAERAAELVDKIASAMTGWDVSERPTEEADAWRANARDALKVIAEDMHHICGLAVGPGHGTGQPYCYRPLCVLASNYAEVADGDTD